MAHKQARQTFKRNAGALCFPLVRLVSLVTGEPPSQARRLIATGAVAVDGLMYRGDLPAGTFHVAIGKRPAVEATVV